MHFPVDNVKRCGTMVIPSTKEFLMSTGSAYTPERAEYVKNNRDKMAHYAAKSRDRLKLEMVAAYGGECIACGIDDPVVLCLDHINDDAFVEKEQFGLNHRGGYVHYMRLRAEGWPKDRFQLMCYNCNARKEHERRRADLTKRWGDSETADRVLVQAKRPPSRKNTSGFKGVFWSFQRNKWTARMMIDAKNKHLGFFTNIADAARAYKAAALAHWGPEANVPSEEEILEIAARADKRHARVAEVITVNHSTKELGL